jgi:hypothetical protein
MWLRTSRFSEGGLKMGTTYKPGCVFMSSALLIGAAFLGTVGYIALHFIEKFW